MSVVPAHQPERLGSIYNHQTWGAWADIMDQNGNPIRGFSSGVAWEAVDFSPAWSIRMS
ncbi:hypothetical protein [Micromonospora ureilytica]|uniref:hypothetical protein n=1 Tax=Micromonospora ureilytica TaxID=709868 RepID=UPI004039476A